jgi:cytochrome c peroxidase
MVASALKRRGGIMVQAKQFLSQLVHAVPRKTVLFGGALLGVSLVVGVGFAVGEKLTARADEKATAPFDRAINANTTKLLENGRQIFRFDTFGDQVFWGDTIKLHQAIEGSKFGGVGPGVSPATALAVGLKVDVDALPEQLQKQLQRGKVDLNDPAVTLALLKLNSVVGVTGFFNANGSLKSMGIQCAFCHSTVDNSFAFGIGHRVDGVANRDLEVGQIINLSPDLSAVDQFFGLPDATVRTVLKSWSRGTFDAEVFLDGKAFHNDQNGVNRAPTVLPNALGLAGVNLHTYTGWGQVTYWNAFVANLEMHGVGTFFDPRINNAAQFPIAVKNHTFDVRQPEGADQITSKLAALHVYQLDIAAPRPPAGSFSQAAARRGAAVFGTAPGTDPVTGARVFCSTCHVPPLYTEPGWNIHSGAEVGVDDFQADRTPAVSDGTSAAPVHGYRTTPLDGAWTKEINGPVFHSRGGGFFHDGRFATLMDVVNHYNTVFAMGLTDQQKGDLVEFLKSLPSTGAQVSDSGDGRSQAGARATGAPPVAQFAQMAGSSPLAAILLGSLFALAGLGTIVRRKFAR